MELPKSSREYFGNPLKGLLSNQIRFQLKIPPQLLQLPINQGCLDLKKIPPVQKLVLGDVFHASNRKEIIETHQKGIKLINEAIKSIQDATPDTTINNFITHLENFNFLVDYLKEYAPGLKEQSEKYVESRFVEKKLLELQDYKCAFAHSKVEKYLKEMQECEDDAKTLFLHYMSGQIPLK